LDSNIVKNKFVTMIVEMWKIMEVVVFRVKANGKTVWSDSGVLI